MDSNHIDLTTNALLARDLSCCYGQFQAVKRTDIVLRSGEVTALTGPNGAGKTTLLLCLSGLIKPTTGEVLVDGFHLYRDEVEAKRRLALVPDVPTFYQELTAWEHLQFIALAYGLGDEFEKRAEELLLEFDLWEARYLLPHAFSRGMRLKLGIILALIRPFQVLLLDEPTSALDLESTEILRGKLTQLRDEGKAILLSTHDAALVHVLSDSVWRMKFGQLDVA